RLFDKNAIVTGGGAGIGRAIAELFGREGARIAILDRDAELAETTQAALRTKGIDVEAYCVDVTDPKDIAAAVADFSSKVGGMIHVLVNNAGIAEFSDFEQTALDSWNRIMAVNVTGTFLCSQAVLPLMKQHGGAIVNMASIAGLIGIPKMPAYCASKAAVIGLTRQMAADYTGQGIRVNCICPGRISGTELDRWIREVDKDEATRAKMAKYPINRFGKPEEIAQAALFLASDESGFMSGAVLTVDGGMTAI
ncbi:MAG: SDR family NAD(P)-dependent oxidoreductase, partial [Gammaproteobacteria bacterium]